MTRLLNLIFITALMSANGCFSVHIPTLPTNFYEQLYLSQPIKVDYLSKDKETSTHFEMHVEKEADNFKIYGVHPFVGKIFLVDVKGQNASIDEDMIIFDNNNLKDLLSSLSDEFKNNPTWSCKLDKMSETGNYFRFTFSNSCR